VVEAAIDIKSVSAAVYGIARNPSKANAENLLIDGYLPPLPSPYETTKGNESQPEEQECPGGEERPAENARCRPVVIVVHGGGCAGGSRRDELESELGYWLAQRGYAAFSVDYRLAGACTDGGALMAANDVKSAVRYLRTRAGDLRLDTSRIALIGASAGAIAVLEAALVRLGPGDVTGRKGPVHRKAPHGGGRSKK
jgi:acetyl esterase/lipase